MAVVADRAGLHHELHRLLDGHEVARDVGVGDGERVAGGELGAERGEHRAAAPEHVSEPHAQVGARLAAAVVRGERLGDPLRVPERARPTSAALSVEMFTNRSTPATAAASSTDTVPHTLVFSASPGCVSSSGRCLSAAAWKTTSGSISWKIDATRARSRMSTSSRFGVVEEGPALDRELHAVQSRLVAVDHHELGGLERRDLAAQLGADRPAGAGDHDALAVEVLGRGGNVGLDRVPAEEVGLGGRPEVADAHVAVEQLAERSARLGRRARPRAPIR